MYVMSDEFDFFSACFNNWNYNKFINKPALTLTIIKKIGSVRV